MPEGEPACLKNAAARARPTTMSLRSGVCDTASCSLAGRKEPPKTRSKALRRDPHQIVQLEHLGVDYAPAAARDRRDAEDGDPGIVRRGGHRHLAASLRWEG
jgi:hypothetical protein